MLAWAAEVGSTRDRSTATYEQRTLSNPEAEVADAVARCDHGPIPVRGRQADGHKIVHELLLTRSQPAIGQLGEVLPIYMEALGLVEMGNEGVARVVHGGDPLSRMWIQTWQRIDDVVIAKGILTESEVADMRRAYKDPTFTYRAQLMQSVGGRRRSQQS